MENIQLKKTADLDLCNRVKDFARAPDWLTPLVGLLQNVLQNYTLFEQKVIKHTLKAIAQLIDWQDLTHFACLVPFLKEFVKMKTFRAPAFESLGSIVGKGMVETEKIKVVF